jgi:hypothetical protein
VKGKQLGLAIEALLDSHPWLEPSSAGHARYARRFVTAEGVPIALQPHMTQFHNLWVRADSVRRRVLEEIPCQLYECANFHVSKPNHNLFGESAFRDTDLFCFAVSTLWQAVRVIDEVAGDGAPW